MSLRKDTKYDYLAKTLIIGDSGVGKTNILTRYCDDNFLSSHLTTIGIDFKVKTLEIDSKIIKMQIWDTAGQERFKTVTQTYYKGAMGIVLVYAINNRESFDSIQGWVSQIKMHATSNVAKILIGNKSDAEADRKVSQCEGQKLAQQYQIPLFMEVSAKEDINISQTFQAIAKLIKEKVLDGDDNAYSKRFPQGSKIDAVRDQSKKKKCC